MSLNIQLTIDPSYDCFENLIIAVAKYYNSDYEMMSLKTWGFKYKKGENRIGERVVNDTYSDLKLLESYHGLSFNKHLVHNVDSIDPIIDNIDKGIPIIISINSYWCHWTDSYQKLNMGHFCLVKRVNDSGNLIVLDYQNRGSEVELLLNDFYKGFNYYLVPQKCKPIIVNYRWKELISCSLDYFDKYRFAFDDIREFSKDILNIDINNEIGDGDLYNNTESIHLLRNIVSVGDKRGQFSSVLKYIANKCDNSHIFSLAQNLQYISTLWASVRGMLIKLLMTNDSKMSIKLSAKLKEIADIEEKTLFEFRDLLNERSVQPKIFVEESCANIPSTYHYISLHKYANNIGLGYSLDSKEIAAFSQGSRFLYDKDHIHGMAICIDSMRFKLSTNNENLPDNIICQGQEIIISDMQKIPKCIMILGCSEYGSYSERMELVMSEEETIEVPIELSNWSEGIGYFGESIAFECDFAERIEGKVELFPFKVNMFAKSYQIKSKNFINKIVLPYCPNMHIFAITIGM